jgi:hypothetical protein
MSDQTPSPLSGALAAIRHGWRVIRLEPAGKVPAGKWRGHETGDADLVRSWFTKDSTPNIGVVADASGLVILDEDTPGALDAWAAAHGVDLPPTFTVTTGRGRHLYFDAGQHTYGNASPFRAEGHDVDVRGAGYVVGPGSVHGATGAMYAVADRRDPVPVPAALHDYLTEAEADAPAAMPTPARRQQETADPWLRAAISGALEDLSACRSAARGTEPRWDRTTFAVACRLVELSNASEGAYPLEEARSDFMATAPTDGAFGPAQHEHKWADALREVGSRRAERRASRNVRGVDIATSEGDPYLPSPCSDISGRSDQAPSDLSSQGSDISGRSAGVEPISLEECHRVFLRWLGATYDLEALDAILSAAAVERLDGDPLWILLVSGSGNAKTETVAPLAGAGALVRSSISSEGALLSASPKRERTEGATGGLLREMGSRGLLVLKDFTSILSMNRDLRVTVLAALREVYDGAWTRNVGTDGGRALEWEGRIGLVGAVTTKYDAAHEVISSMGDRFALVRTDSSDMAQRASVAHQALAALGHEEEMREDLASAVAGVIAGVDKSTPLPPAMVEPLVEAANVVTLVRTAVERDSRGDVISAHAPEAPTRFLKMLGQVARGILALGGDETTALATALRVARDSVPPLRLELLEAFHGSVHPLTGTQVGQLIDKPRTTVRRECDALHALGVLENAGEDSRGAWLYRLAPGVTPTPLRVQHTDSEEETR